MSGHIVGGLALIFLGVLVIVSRLLRWKWFNEHYKVRNIEDTLGEKNADVFYIILALLLVILGILIMTHLIG